WPCRPPKIGDRPNLRFRMYAAVDRLLRTLGLFHPVCKEAERSALLLVAVPERQPNPQFVPLYRFTARMAQLSDPMSFSANHPTAREIKTLSLRSHHAAAMISPPKTIKRGVKWRRCGLSMLPCAFWRRKVSPSPSAFPAPRSTRCTRR